MVDIIQIKVECSICGHQLIEVLGLKHDRKGFYKTAWGKKTFEGLRETIENIIQETDSRY